MILLQITRYIEESPAINFAGAFRFFSAYDPEYQSNRGISGNLDYKIPGQLFSSQPGLASENEFIF